MLWRATTAGLVFVLILLISAIAALIFVDWNAARGWTEDFLSAMAGREVNIGHLDIDPDWQRTHIVLRDFSIANAEWGTRQPLARIDELRLAIANRPLLYGRTEFPRVTLHKPEIFFQISRDGRANWQLGAAAEATAEVTAPEERTEFPYIGGLTIENGKLAYRDASRDLDLKGTIATASGKARGNIGVALKGTLENRPVTLDFNGGSLAELRRREHEPYPFDLSVHAGDTEIHAEGTARKPVQLQDFDIDLRISGPSMAEIFPIFGIPLPPTAPYHIEGRLQREGKTWRLDEFRGKVDDSDLHGWLTVDRKPERPILRANLDSKKLDFHDLGGLIGLKPGTGDQVEVPSGESGLLPETPINTESINAMDMNVRLKGERVLAPSVPIDSLDMQFIIKSGRVHVQPLAFHIGEDRIAGTVTLDASQSPPSGTADLTASQVGLKPFFSNSRFADEMSGHLSGHIDIEGSGQSLAGMLAASNGSLIVGMRDGSISALVVEAMGLDLVEALGLVIEGDTPVRIRCGLMNSRVVDGEAQLNRSFIDTTDSLLVMSGTVNLQKETLHINIQAHEKDFSLISATAPVTISGPFTEPGVQIGGIDPLPFFEMGDQENVVCSKRLKLLDRAVEE